MLTDRRRFKLIALRDDTTETGVACGEGAAFPLDQAVRLIAAGVCGIDDTEPESEALEAAVRAHKQAPSVRGEMYLCQPRYF